VTRPHAMLVKQVNPAGIPYRFLVVLHDAPATRIEFYPLLQ
jgi:hypothetical protein